jgi:hypothetical protein
MYSGKLKLTRFMQKYRDLLSDQNNIENFLKKEYYIDAFLSFAFNSDRF